MRHEFLVTVDADVDNFDFTILVQILYFPQTIVANTTTALTGVIVHGEMFSAEITLTGTPCNQNQSQSFRLRTIETGWHVRIPFC
jgi:hypothetical protein